MAVAIIACGIYSVQRTKGRYAMIRGASLGAMIRAMKPPVRSTVAECLGLEAVWWLRILTVSFHKSLHDEDLTLLWETSQCLICTAIRMHSKIIAPSPTPMKKVEWGAKGNQSLAVSDFEGAKKVLANRW
jgi:hypothetical protein